MLLMGSLWYIIWHTNYFFLFPHRTFTAVSNHKIVLRSENFPFVQTGRETEIVKNERKFNGIHHFFRTLQFF
jgi:hypothetical protein